MSFKRTGKAPIIGVLDTKKCAVCGDPSGRCAHLDARPRDSAASPQPAPSPSPMTPTIPSLTK